HNSMAPRILTLLRCPVTGISGECPTRLQVACRVESWRKLASSVKISAQFFSWDFFLAWDRCSDASGLARWDWRESAPDAAVAQKNARHAATCARVRDDTELQTLAQ